ncbi:MAG: HupE/UreJ family protein [Gammaproteobacteria bacterium]|nr:HupE/UreJ family protein [Gammaproteobacteria bacterium]
MREKIISFSCLVCLRHGLARLILSTTLLTAAPAAWAHPALFDGGLLANLTHLFSQPDHLLLLAGIGVAAGIAMYIRNKSSLRGGDDDNH